MTNRFDILNHMLHRFGLHVSLYPLANSLDRELSILLRLLEINCVLDVGAHRGEYGSRLRGLGYRGRIVSFEPVGANFEVLRHRSQNDPSWTCYQYALGSLEETRAIGVRVGTDFTSFLPSNEAAQRRFGDKPRVVSEEFVPVRRLDVLLDMCVQGIPVPHVLLKCDTQGFDLEVVRGAAERIVEIVGLQMEMPTVPLYEGAPGMMEMIPVLSQLGFRIVGQFPVSRDRDRSVIEFDVLLRR
jgi:FkbM family methyltransferase